MISIIVAIASNGVIGKNNQLPWHYPEDLRYFKEKTLNHRILMGRKTFDSIVSRHNKLLPNRAHLVVTRNSAFSYKEVEVVLDPVAFFQEPHEDEVFVIGGRDLYELALPYATRLYITYINKPYVGDTYFPAMDLTNYHCIQEKQKEDLLFVIYEKGSL